MSLQSISFSNDHWRGTATSEPGPLRACVRERGSHASLGGRSWRATTTTAWPHAFLNSNSPHPACMADTRAPRPSTDEGMHPSSPLVSVAMSLLSPDVQLVESETAPLLQNVSHPDGDPAPGDEEPTFLDRLSNVVQEPLSPLTKILLIATLIFLLLSSIFIGLFAGAQHKLNSGGGGGKTTVVVTATTTAHATTTAVSTTTVAVPAPGPTSPPAEVRSSIRVCLYISRQPAMLWPSRSVFRPHA